MRLFIFPFDKVDKGEKVIIWGAGVVGKEYLKQLSHNNYAKIIAVVDSSKEGECYEGHTIISPEKSEEMWSICDKVVISTAKRKNIDEIIKYLSKKNVPDDKMVYGIDKIVYDEECQIDALKDLDVDFLKRILTSGNNTIIGLPQYLEHKENKTEFDRLFKRFSYGNKANDSKDSLRLFFLWKNLEETLKSVPGNIAELGVYKGSTASLFADYSEKYNRKLYLFDTFEGFSDSDKVGIDRDRDEDFTDTSLSYVMRFVGHEDLTLYYKGYFPDTLDSRCRDDRFAFVHIDCDLYKPIFEGLKFFYKRLNKGGMIVVHDYLSGKWEGATQAVDEFCTENQVICKVLMPDMSGSIVIIKDK